MDPDALARSLGGDPTLIGMPLVVLAAWAERRPDAATPESGFAGTLRKPLRPTRLHELLRRVLRAGDVSPALAPAKITEPALPGAVTRSLRILVAEDNVVNQRLALRMLEKAGHRVDLAANGRAAVESVGQVAYDLVLMDCLMPEMDGFEATRAIRAAELGTDRRLPIVALTANAMQGEREKCYDAGMDDYLAKPFTKQTLTAIIERWTGQDR
jgi:two-component system sensor histidine kinase/response regulator